MINRIEQTFKKAKTPCLITFTMANDPDFDVSLSALKALVDGGADILEIGMPFTDPAADGVTIQKAGQRALKSGSCMKETLRLVRALRENNQTTPIILMGYANPVHAYGYTAFCCDARAAGVDGLLIVDMPPEESDELRAAMAAEEGLALIRLVTPTTDEARLVTILDGAGGFLYYVSVTGVTGGQKASPEDVVSHIDVIRKHTVLPIVVGFGIRTPEDAAALGEGADGVVVGSAIVQKIAQNASEQGFEGDLTAQIRALKTALDRG
jgi:tryptophan synthase alpha chain